MPSLAIGLVTNCVYPDKLLFAPSPFVSVQLRPFGSLSTRSTVGGRSRGIPKRVSHRLTRCEWSNSMPITRRPRLLSQTSRCALRLVSRALGTSIKSRRRRARKAPLRFSISVSDISIRSLRVIGIALGWESQWRALPQGLQRSYHPEYDPAVNPCLIQTTNDAQGCA